MRGGNRLVAAVVAAALLGSGSGVLGQAPAQEPAAPAAEEAEGEPEPFVVEHVIHPLVAAMPTPEFRDEIVVLPMAISSRSDLAQKHVLQGMAYIYAAWDFEAYRHFCEAVRVDPDCIMAYWGIGLALASPNNEFVRQRIAAINRMLDLLDAEVGDPPRPVATPVEKEYCLSLALLYSANAKAASRAFKRMSERYPNNLQVRLLATLLQRDGYTEFGEPLFGQEQAMEQMMKIQEEHPDNLAVLSFVAMLFAEAPDPVGHLRPTILPLVRKLVERVPDFAPFQHMLGHYEWRCGNHALASKALSSAVLLYSAHMKANKMTFHTCDAWVRCRIYQAVALHSRGKFVEAMTIAADVAALQIDPKRLGSAGANIVLWEARTLPARLYAARGAQGDLQRAIDSLPKKGDAQIFPDKTLAIFYLEGLRQYLGGRQRIEAGNLDEAREFRAALSVTGEALLKRQRNAIRSSAISEYLRALRTLELLTAELRGLIALNGKEDERSFAFNWFKAATDKQSRPSLLMPPAIVYPMESRLADFYIRTGEFTKAAKACQDGLERYPNDLHTLEVFRDALERDGRDEDAEKIGRQIGLVKGQ